MSNEVEVGVGQLNWCGAERRSDRYGAIGLWADATPWCTRAMNLDISDLCGRRGTLRVEILETRDSDHIGDLFRGLSPGGAEVGDVYDLGSGVLFRSDVENHVGVRPDDGRQTDWLDPELLYKAHQQTVRLTFALDD